MGQEINCRLLTAAARFRAQVSPVVYTVDKVALAQVFLGVLLFSPVSVIPPLLCIHS
jgi:hypothetical protein